MKYETFKKFRENLHFAVEDKLGDVTTPIHQYIDYACDTIDNTVGRDRFMNAYCARSVHCSHKGGLADHTIKVFSELINMLFSGDGDDRFYKQIIDNVNLPALIIGTIIHDIGKVYEYDGNQNNIYHYVTHLMLGIELIGSQVADDIISKYDHETYWRIISILGQHHGEFGEKPQTLEAYLVHLADYQETKLQILEEQFTTGIRPNADGHSMNWLIDSKYIPFRLNVQGGK